MTQRKLQQLAPLAVAVALSAGHFASFDIRSTPIVTDVRYFVYLAWRVSQGAVLHLELFENKTQLATFSGAALYRLGSVLGDPLLAIRVGYLAIAALGGVLAFAIHRQLNQGRAVPGLIGLLAYCAFPLLGILPSIGNVPKLLMPVLASVAALCVLKRRWFWSGVAGGLAFMDWQIGALAGLGALAAAAVSSTPRLRAVLQVVAGGVAGIAPFLLYYASKGALAATFEQTIVATFLRGSTAVASQSIGERWQSIERLVEIAGPPYSGLFYLGFAGMGVALLWLWQRRNSETAALLLCLSVYHFGVVAFSALNFQRYGDLFLLFHSVAFFLALALNGLYALALVPLDASGPDRQRVRHAVGAAALLLVTALARPGPLRPETSLRIPGIKASATLADQQEVADQIHSEFGGQKIVFLEDSEIAFLMRYVNPLPYIYWNAAAWSTERESENETKRQTILRILASEKPDAIAAKKAVVEGRLEGYQPRTFSSSNQKYSVTLYVRES